MYILNHYIQGESYSSLSFLLAMAMEPFHPIMYWKGPIPDRLIFEKMPGFGHLMYLREHKKFPNRIISGVIMSMSTSQTSLQDNLISSSEWESPIGPIYLTTIFKTTTNVVPQININKLLQNNEVHIYKIETITVKQQIGSYSHSIVKHTPNNGKYKIASEQELMAMSEEENVSLN